MTRRTTTVFASFCCSVQPRATAATVPPLASAAISWYVQSPKRMRRGLAPSQLPLAWLLRRSPVILPIPGTSTVAHLEENTAAASVTLSDDEFEALATVTAVTG